MISEYSCVHFFELIERAFFINTEHDNKTFKNLLHYFAKQIYVTGDMLYVTQGGGWTFSQNFSSLAFLAWERHIFAHISTKGNLGLLMKKGICIKKKSRLHRVC